MLEEARGQAEAQKAERSASISHELAAERSELLQAEQAKQTERCIDALRPNPNPNPNPEPRTPNPEP